MTTILVWLVALAVHRDGHGLAIPRPYGAASIIAEVADRQSDPKWFAATLDVLAAHESGYRTSAVGDGGRSCGAYQTPCARTPKDGRGQTELAVAILRQAIEACPGHPLWAYASGRCVSTRIADYYEREVARELGAP